MSAVTDLLVNAILNSMSKDERGHVFDHAQLRVQILKAKAKDPLLKTELETAAEELWTIRKKFD